MQLLNSSLKHDPNAEYLLHLLGQGFGIQEHNDPIVAL